MNRFEIDTTYGILLCKTRVSNKKQCIFLKLAIDTGASITMVSIESVLAIGIDPTKSKRHIEITTASGTILVPVVKIPSFACLGVEVKNMDVVCHNLPPESTVEGLLGLNFLKNAKAIIDFSNNTITT